ncbi:MAG: hypothetical protein QG567_1073 [Campylobacterota bacterium]|nr:hypothetical protein [Candidatus Poribacteria bacterium]MDQ1339917.1 hypothetical protein [Campylobacterota bacterium]
MGFFTDIFLGSAMNHQARELTQFLRKCAKEANINNLVSFLQSNNINYNDSSHKGDDEKTISWTILIRREYWYLTATIDNSLVQAISAHPRSSDSPLNGILITYYPLGNDLYCSVHEFPNDFTEQMCNKLELYGATILSRGIRF